MDSSMKSNYENRPKIWIDICHPPQAVFYTSLIKEFKRRGFGVIVTARDSFETCELLEKAGLKYHRIGKHYGKRKIMKSIGLIIRATQLWRFIHSQRLSIAVSHGSPYQIVVCSLLRVPSVAIGDNEHSKIWAFAKLSKKVLLPKCMPDSVIKVSLRKVVKYPGIKEDVYINDFQADEAIFNKLSIDSRNIVVTLRPPATKAHYHNPQSEILFSKITSYLSEISNVTIIILPRTPTEDDLIKNIYGCNNGRIIILKEITNGLNLIWHSDLVISGGGTMIREAAALGVPAYSFFQGNKLSVDKYLANIGRLKFIQDESDIMKICLKKKESRTIPPKTKNNEVKRFIVDEILTTLKRNKSLSQYRNIKA